VSDRVAQVQTTLHFVALVSFLWAFWSGATQLLAVAIVLSFSFLLWVVARSWWQYLSVSKGASKVVTVAQSP
jgi:polyferredoxin